MKVFLECFHQGKLVRRVNVTQSSDQGRENIEKYLNQEWPKVLKVETKEELETGFFK